MGSCASSTRQLDQAPTVMVIDLDGQLKKFKNPITASRVLSDYPNRFLCSYETLTVGSAVEVVPDDGDLLPGHIYFLMPLSKLNSQISLKELCSMAVKASKVCNISSTLTNGKSRPPEEFVAGVLRSVLRCRISGGIAKKKPREF